LAACSNRAWVICDRPALCRQTNRARNVALSLDRGGLLCRGHVGDGVRRRRRLGADSVWGNVAPVYGLTTVSSIDICISMSINMKLSPKTKRPAGEPCCEPVVYPEVEREQAQRMASIAKALGDPVRLQLVDVLKKHAGKVCVCELVPLFDLSQPTVSHHLKVLREAGIVGSERQGLWAYYYVIPDALKELSAWLS